MKKLYQQQMLYRKRDGSFGINIDQKSEGSIWCEIFLVSIK